MILKSQTRLPVGKVITDWYINDQYGVTHQIPVVILAEVTKEDYLRETEKEFWGEIFKDDIFYRVSID